jgi:CRISPR-associated endonuclease/helicase Cas3
VLIGGSPLALGDDSWAEARRALWRWLAETLDADFKPDTRKTLSGPWAAALTGLVITSDWIASNARWFSPTECPLEDYVPISRERTAAALDELTWRRWETFAADFPRRFGFPPRPMQQLIEQVASDLDGPAMVLIEAETGSGKTEAALHLAAEWTLEGWASGLFVALPTRATSNAMFRRILDFLTANSKQPGVQTQLVHGWASLEAEFEHLLGYSYSGQPEESATAAVADRWFTYRRRGLLAPIGVGTIDQLLMGALRARFTPLRVWGVADKVVIVDEVHAYDVYMSTLLDRLLEWLGALAVPVVILSATLPADRKARLIAAYSGSEPPSDRSYPSVTVVSPGGRPRALPAASSKVRQIEVEKAPTAEPAYPEVSASLAMEWSRRGANVLVVCNTVARAQTVASLLDDLGERLHLVHARLRHSDRMERERKLIAMFGPDGDRPQGHVVVGTQVLEQSLDLDLDLLITDLAPVDLLIQRVGRVHRHTREWRPVPAPLMIVTGFRQGPHPLIDPGSEAIYHRWVLHRTLDALPDSFQEPDDVPALISAVYDPPSKIPHYLAEAWDDYQQQTKVMQELANTKFVPDPRGEVDLQRVTDPAVEDLAPDEAPPGTHFDLIAQTRLGAPSVMVVVSFPGESEEPLDMLRRSLQLSSPRRLVQTLIQMPPAPSHHPVLRHARRIELDPMGVGRVGDFTIRYDPLLGLIVENEEAESEPCV